MGVGHDVALRVDDDARGKTSLLAYHQVRSIVAPVVDRTISGDEHLHDAWRDTCDEGFDRLNCCNESVAAVSAAWVGKARATISDAAIRRRAGVKRPCHANRIE